MTLREQFNEKFNKEYPADAFDSVEDWEEYRRTAWQWYRFGNEVVCTPAPPVMVGEASAMPGTSGFTMAVFKATDVPVGTKIYTCND